MINLTVIYNTLGIIISTLSIIMVMLPSQDNPEEKTFNISKKSLATGIFLTGISMFVAQFEEQLEKQQFEKLDVLMLLFFFLIGQGIMFSILVLYHSPYADKQHLQRALLPVLPWFALYTLIYFFTGDIRVYSFSEFFRLMPEEPLLILRCVILLSMAASIIYTLRLCHKAKSEYNKLIIDYFSETNFSRSIWLSNLLGCAEALSLWVFLTYFYTTPILEVIVGVLITVFFILCVKEFHYYSKRYIWIQPAILLANQNKVPLIEEAICAISERIIDNIVNIGDKKQIEEDIVTTDENAIFDNKCADLLTEWIKREDKPYVKPGLTIGDVANDLDIPKYRLSGYINQKLSNFNTWIKELRIREASSLLIADSQLSISVIAKNVAFVIFQHLAVPSRKLMELHLQNTEATTFPKKIPLIMMIVKK